MSATSTIERLKTESERLARGRNRLAEMKAKQLEDEAAHAERLQDFLLSEVRKRGITAGDLPILLDSLHALGDAGRKDEIAGDRETGDPAASTPAPEEAAVSPPAPDLNEHRTRPFETPADPAVHLVIRKGRNPAKAAELKEAGWCWHGKNGGYWHCHAAPARVDRLVAQAREIFGGELVVETDPPRQVAPAAMPDEDPENRAHDVPPTAAAAE